MAVVFVIATVLLVGVTKAVVDFRAASSHRENLRNPWDDNEQRPGPRCHTP
jgi:hypothetical protein